MRDVNKNLDHKLELYKNQVLNFEIQKNDDLYRAYHFLKNNLFRPTCSVRKMREECRIPQKNFSGRFKQFIGMSPSKFISYHRIEVAKLILSDIECKDIPISKIAYAVGYNRLSSFCTAFKRKEGISPSSWQKQELESIEKVK